MKGFDVRIGIAGLELRQFRSDWLLFKHLECELWCGWCPWQCKRLWNGMEIDKLSSSYVHSIEMLLSYGKYSYFIAYSHCQWKISSAM